MTRFGMMAAIVGVLVCGAAVAPAQLITSQPADRLTCGDWQIDIGMSTVQLTEEQKAKFKTMFEGFAKEIKAAKDAFDVKAKPTGEKIKAMHDDARKNGTMKDLLGKDEYKTLQAEMGKMLEEEKKASAARHDRMFDEVIKALTPSQKRRFLMKSGLASQDPKRILQSRAALMLDQWAAGVELSDEKYDQLMTKLVEMIEKQDANVAEAHETDNVKVRDWWMQFTKKVRQYVESQLTEAEIKQAAATRLDHFQKTTVSITDMVAKSIERLDPTADQKQKAAALATEARDKMLKIEPEDAEAWGKVYQQLRTDVDKLLTEEQKTKRDTPTMIDMAKPAN